MKQKTLLLITLSLILTLSCQAQTQKPDKQNVSASIEKQIDTIFSEYNNLDSPGVAVAATQDGEVVFKKGYGTANLEHRIPINPNLTKFNIGSTSKQVTVFAVLLLAEQKKLSMDDDVRKHISELRDFGKKVTLRNLAHHTGGVRSELAILAMAGWSPGDVITRNMVLQMIYRQKELDFEPGKESSYSNAGFTLLSEVVERVSGQSFAEFTSENIFKPLEMNDSFFVDSHQSVIKNMAYPYFTSQGVNYKNIANEGYSGSTGVFTTASDFTKWALNFKQPKVGSKKIIDEMNTLGVLNNGETFGFGMGQFIEEYRGVKQIQHGGGTAGYIAYLGRFPDQDFNVILMGNSSSINARGRSLEIADVFLKKHFKDLNQNSTKRISLSAEQLSKFTGNYWNNKDRAVSVSVNTGNLNYAIGGGPTVTLAPVSKGDFEMLNTGIARTVRFKTDSNGKNTMHVIEGGREVETFETYKPKVYKTEELKQYTGRYYSEELDTTYSLIIENGNLVVTHLRFTNNVLTPVISGIFTNTGWRFSTLRFERNSSDKIDGFRISSMRARNIHFKKMS